MLFQSSRDVRQQNEEDCELVDVILYENARNVKICKDDFVLVNIDLKKKYYPGQVISSEYLYGIVALLSCTFISSFPIRPPKFMHSHVMTIIITMLKMK